MIFGLLLNISWNANLISYLSTSKTILPFTSLETLIDSTDYRIAIIPNTAQEESFKDHNLPIRQKAWDERIAPYLEQYSSWYQNKGSGNFCNFYFSYQTFVICIKEAELIILFI